MADLSVRKINYAVHLLYLYFVLKYIKILHYKCTVNTVHFLSIKRIDIVCYLNEFERRKGLLVFVSLFCQKRIEFYRNQGVI